MGNTTVAHAQLLEGENRAACAPPVPSRTRRTRRYPLSLPVPLAAYGRYDFPVMGYRAMTFISISSCRHISCSPVLRLSRTDVAVLDDS
jgi:hypothetical protein